MIPHLDKKELLFALLIVLAGGIIWSVWSKEPSEPKYPSLLVDADSAIVQGHYHYADTLLALYDKRANTDDETCHRYRQLLTLNRKFADEVLTNQDQGTVDSLYQYYESFGSSDKFVRTLILQAQLSKTNGDYPTEIELCMKAENILGANDSSAIQGWIEQLKGDLFFDQRMFEQCIPCYRAFYDIAKRNNDRLRMSYGATRMGRLYTIKNDADSAIYYYKQSIKVCEGLPEEESAKYYSELALCDIYIQTEEFDSALAIMPRDSLNLPNWADWHLGQQHVDSAIYYYKQMLGRYDWYVETQTLRTLAELSQQTGDTNQALEYYAQLATAEDSLREQSKVEDTQKAMARDRYNQLAKERDRIKLKKQQMEQLTLGILIIFFVMGLVVLLMWRSDRRKAELEQVHDKLLLKEREEQYKQSQKKLEENQEKLTELERQLEEARLQSDAERAERLEQETRMLEAQNASIVAIQQQKERLRKQLHLSNLYRRLKLDDGVTKRQLTDGEWTQLATDYLDPLYDRLTNRLLALADLSATELRICYMLKLEIAPADMADILCRTTSAVSQSRRRIYKKLTGQPGSAQQLDELIEAF